MSNRTKGKQRTFNGRLLINGLAGGELKTPENKAHLNLTPNTADRLTEKMKKYAKN